ncbi:methyltransferase domain-containing protein [Thermodesulfobacteriota bacterium]
MDAHSKVSSLVNSIIEDFGDFDLDPFREQHESIKEKTVYLNSHRHEYIRTIHDILEYSKHHPVKKILEIGAFFGVVSIAHAKLGFQVCAVDLPEYMSMPEQKERFGRYGIEIAEVRLQDYLLPFADERFDVIVMCEVLEHLNFNPLPLIKEINRVGAPKSLFYLSLPNLAQVGNRQRLFSGYPIQTPIQRFFDQLDPTKPEIAYGHWREYTASEIKELLVRMGYSIHRQYYFGKSETSKTLSLRNLISRIIYRCFPTLKENQTTLAIREDRTNLIFTIPNTVHEKIGTF